MLMMLHFATDVDAPQWRTGVIAAFRHRQRLTHRFHGILLLMLLNELIPPSYVLENTTKAFFKMSRTCRVTSSSRLRRRSSSSWAV